MTALLQVRQDPQKGRCFFTSASVRAGQIVLESHAYGFVVDTKSLLVVCSNCHQQPVLVDGVAVEQHLREPLPYSCSSVRQSHVHANSSNSPMSGSGGSALSPDTKNPAVSDLSNINSSDTNPVLDSTCCNLLRYCSLACAHTDYERFHRFECDLLKEWHSDPTHYMYQASDYVRDYSRLMLRIITRSGWESYYRLMERLHRDPMVQAAEHNHHAHSHVESHKSHDKHHDTHRSKHHDAVQVPWIYPFTFQDSIWPLCDNVRLFPHDRLQSFKPLAALLTRFAKDHPLHPDLPDPESDLHAYLTDLGITCSPLESLMMLLICKEECNSFGVYTFNYTGSKTERQSYGLGVYPSAVYFNHSCKPSVGHVARSLPDTDVTRSGSATNLAKLTDTGMSMFGSTILFFATRNLEQNEEAMIAYLPLEGTLEHRQKAIKDIFYFECNCERCLEETLEKNKSPIAVQTDITASAMKDQKSPLHQTIETFGLCLCREIGCHGWLVPAHLSHMGGLKKKPSVSANHSNDTNTSTGSEPDLKTVWICEGCGHESG
ncbi:Histone-lysine N-methyltransferase set-6 [Batrachochytrium dendrobatidis]